MRRSLLDLLLKLLEHLPNLLLHDVRHVQIDACADGLQQLIGFGNVVSQPAQVQILRADQLVLALCHLSSPPVYYIKRRNRLSSSSTCAVVVPRTVFNFILIAPKVFDVSVLQKSALAVCQQQVILTRFEIAFRIFGRLVIDHVNLISDIGCQLSYSLLVVHHPHPQSRTNSIPRLRAAVNDSRVK